MRTDRDDLFDCHLHDGGEQQTAGPERIAIKQRTRQILLTYNLWEETIAACDDGTRQTSAGAARWFISIFDVARPGSLSSQLLFSARRSATTRSEQRRNPRLPRQARCPRLPRRG